MPELPEVETIKLGLQKRIIGLKIQKIQILSPKSFIGNPNLAEGRIVLKIWRKGKILGMDLGTSLRATAKQSSQEIIHTQIASSKTSRNDNSIILLIHLKMSGQLIYIPNDERITNNNERFIGGHPTENMLGKMPNLHTRVIFSFSDGSHLYFNDQRKFGWVKIIENFKFQISNFKILKNLGPEPLEKDFTWQVLKQNLFRHKSMSVKVAIMDQTVVSGIGNIYSNEACFDARLDPRTKVGNMGDKEFKSLYSGIVKALRDGIAHGGSTGAHFVDSEGRKGYFLDYAFVYGRNNHPCKVCGTEIRKITLGGRGTYFCPKCQV